MSLLALIPIEWRAGAAVAVAIGGFTALGGAAWYLDSRGYHRATLEWTVKYQQREAELAQQKADELERQQTINDAAKAQEARELEDYRVKLEAANALALRLADEAALDPAANNVALDAAAVDRHNRRVN